MEGAGDYSGLLVSLLWEVVGGAEASLSCNAGLEKTQINLLCWPLPHLSHLNLTFPACAAYIPSLKERMHADARTHASTTPVYMNSRDVWLCRWSK